MSQDNRSMQMILAGDLCMRDLSEKIDESYAQKILQDILPYLKQADIRLINLENPLTAADKPIAKSGPNLKGKPENIAFLTAGGFDCAVLANNHLGDYGPAGVIETLSLLDDNGIGHVGGGRNLDESYEPWYVERNGLTAAVVAVAENEFGGAGTDRPGMAGLNCGRLLQAIDAARQNAEFVIVVIHGGNEYNPLPSPRVVDRYRLIARCGADAVIGMHTHCPQGYEQYRGVPIIYSTGNFLFHNEEEPSENSSWYYGYLPKLICTPGRQVNLEIIPYRFDPACTRITPFIGQQSEKMHEYLRKISGLFQDSRQRTDYFKGWCMIGGIGYIDKLVYREKYMREPEWASSKDFLILRNLLTCEAHNEIITQFMVMIENNEIGFGVNMAEEVRKLQVMPI
ncbi:MAG: CapA family protein [Clostridiaceae bacterium]|nr:CapA family protein [Clostridiaceae bacterium]